MANVAHSTLTGANLHEPKGAATATSGYVYVANGSGSGVWTALGAVTNPFGAALLHVREEQSSSVSSTTSVSNASFVKATLNTSKTTEIASASLASSVLSLPAGTYHAIGWSSANATAQCSNSTGNANAALRLRNTTAGTTLIAGVPIVRSTSNNTAGSVVLQNVIENLHPFLTGRFTLGSTSNVELQIYALGNSVSAALPATTGETEVYSDLLIWKLS